MIRELEQLCPGDIIVSFSSMNTGFEHIIPLFAKIRNFKTSYPTPNLLGYKYDDPICLYLIRIEIKTSEIVSSEILEFPRCVLKMCLTPLSIEVRFLIHLKVEQDIILARDQIFLIHG